MCLWIDDDNGNVVLRTSAPVARKPYECFECYRTIDSGERHFVYHTKADYGFRSDRLCVHCRATLVAGSRMTGCPERWWVGEMHGLDPNEGFVGNILGDEGHVLTGAQRVTMLRTAVGRRRKWRRADGSLLDPICDPFRPVEVES